MQKINIAVAILMTLGLVACSSGGSSGQASTQNTVLSNASLNGGLTNSSGSEAQTNSSGSESKTNSLGSEAQTNSSGSESKTNSSGAEAQTNSSGSEAQTNSSGSEAQTNQLEKSPEVATQADTKTLSKTDSGVEIENIKAEDNHFNKQYPFVGAGYSVPKTSGEVLIVSRYNEKSADETNLRVLHIDDKVFEIFPLSATKTINLQSANMIRIAQQGQNATIAIVTDKDTPYYIALNAINSTKDTTTLNGTFNYRGNGYHSHVKDGAKNPNNLADSVVNLTADFNEKVIKGTISSPNAEFKTLEIGGYITNNGFQGKVKETELMGGFFGSEAQEAAGSYINRDKEDPSYGVFNTSKQ